MRVNNGKKQQSWADEVTSSSANKEQQQKQQQHEIFSGYHSLCVRSQVSSDSEDDDDDGGRTNINEHRDDSEEHSNPIARLRSHRIASLPLPPPPPPPSALPLPSSSSSESSRHLSERYSGGSIPSLTDGNNGRTPPRGMLSGPSSSSSQQQQKALLTLLNEMRTLEFQFQQRTSEYAVERTSLMETLSQQSAHISQLERTQQSLMSQNAVLNKRLATMVTRLDRFATGCWQFSSASVKKMSEALHIQVHEWTKAYRIETTLRASAEEEKAIEGTTMEKMQGMHLEIVELKRSNRALRKRMLRRKEKSGRNDESEGSPSEHDDEVSHMTGITQMTSTTSMTASTAKLMEAMAGFLTTHESKGDRQHDEEEDESQSRQRAPADNVVATAEDAVRSSSNPKTGSKGTHKKSVQIATPQSILKSTAKYDRKFNDDRAASCRSHQQQSSTSEQLPNSHQPSMLQPPQHARQPARQKRSHPGLPKSPNMRHNVGGSSSSISSSGSGSGHPSRRNTTAPSVTTPGQTQLDFANFKGDFVEADENDMWLASWGDEASEV